MDATLIARARMPRFFKTPVLGCEWDWEDVRAPSLNTYRALLLSNKSSPRSPSARSSDN